MIRKFLIVLGLCLVVLLVTELIGLAVLRYNINAYADYWKGRANRPGDFTYVAIGDSAGQGLGASRPENGYVGLLAKEIARKTGRKVRVINLSVTGAKVPDALHGQTPRLKDFDADLVTVEIGANDMRSYDKSVFSAHYEQILQALPPGRSVVSDMPYFGTQPQLNDNARDANRVIRGKAKQYGIPVIGLYDELHRRQTPLIYAADFFHPNNRGYRIWYDAFWPVVEKQL